MERTVKEIVTKENWMERPGAGGSSTIAFSVVSQSNSMFSSPSGYPSAPSSGKCFSKVLSRAYHDSSLALVMGETGGSSLQRATKLSRRFVPRAYRPRTLSSQSTGIFIFYTN